MKIVRMDLLRVAIPMVRSFATSWGTISHKESIIVKLHTADGLVGYGETTSFAQPLYNHETINSCLYVLRHFIAPLVVGKSFETPEELALAFRDIVDNLSAKLGPECAFWHLVAQRDGVSLKRLLGGTLDEIPVGESVGMERSVATALGVVEQALAHGYSRIKLKVKPGYDVELLSEIRKRWPDIELTADSNCGYRSDEHLDHLVRLDDYGLAFLEQPFAGSDLVGHAQLQARMKTPICLDESIESTDDARTAQALGSGRVINIKPGRVGGLVESLRIYDFAAEHDIGVWCGGIFETGIGRAFNIALASKERCVYPADMSPYDRFFEADLVSDSFRIKPSGYIDVPDTPGLGFEIDEDNLRRYTKETVTIGDARQHVMM
jgi:O-succinylbenzoate synthase